MVIFCIDEYTKFKTLTYCNCTLPRADRDASYENSKMEFDAEILCFWNSSFVAKFSVTDTSARKIFHKTRVIHNKNIQTLSSWLIWVTSSYVIPKFVMHRTSSSLLSSASSTNLPIHLSDLTFEFTTLIVVHWSQNAYYIQDKNIFPSPLPVTLLGQIESEFLQMTCLKFFIFRGYA